MPTIDSTRSLVPQVRRADPVVPGPTVERAIPIVELLGQPPRNSPRERSNVATVTDVWRASMLEHYRSLLNDYRQQAESSVYEQRTRITQQPARNSRP